MTVNTEQGRMLASMLGATESVAASRKLRDRPIDPEPTYWECPETGLLVPKKIGENLVWRKTLRHKAQDPNFRDSIMLACRDSFLFWCNAFVWTFRQRGVDDEGNVLPITGDLAHVPFLTWPVQDEAATEAITSIRTGSDINFEKSRDMGATWLLMAIADWFFLYQKSINIGAVSRKEELVDKPGDMDTLFEKVRYINRMLPPWMVPQIRDKYMFLHNLELDSTIAGESTNTEVGRGGRKVFYIVDEAAAVRNADQVEDALSQNCSTMIWASTPHGPNTTFHKRIKEKRGVLIQLPWWRHPEKAHGAHQVVDETGRVRWTSPWYVKQTERFSSKTVAQEIDMDHGSSGEMFFDYTELERHRQDHATRESFRGDLIWIDKLTEEQKVQMLQQMDPSKLMLSMYHGRSPWRFWTRLDDADGRPPQYWTYVFGIDISNGAGASNSVISVLAVEIGQIVAKFWDAYCSPEELAMIACAAGVWFGGAKPPAFLCWENNGPGGIFGRKVVSIDYPSFYRQRMDNTLKNTRTPRWGWHSNAERKEVLLGMYRDALSRDDIVNPCGESLDEAADYIYEEQSGALIPAKLREESQGGRALHGDHVIADALCWLGNQEMSKQRGMARRAPRGSYAARREARRKSRGGDPWRK